jgi:C4-dicarboxylate-specific signal transduction histidine kinase
MAIRKLKFAESATATINHTNRVDWKEFVPTAYRDFPYPMLLWNEKENDLWTNLAFENSYGTLQKNSLKQTKNVWPIDQRPLTESVFKEPGRHEGFVHPDKSGRLIPVELRVQSIELEYQSVYLVLVDAVEAKVELQRALIEEHLKLKKTQAALIQSAKLASLGELSAGIAHELNQPLQAIMGYSQELKSQEKLSPTGMEFLSDMVHAAGKMRDIIKSLRAFARDSGTQVIPTSIQHACEEVQRLMHHSLLQSGVELTIHLTGQDLVQANPIQLEQVLVNLIANARDAIAGSGKKDGLIEIKSTLKKGEVCLTVSDNGDGMSPDVLAKIFDPYFTTKEVGKGSGMGLSLSHGLITSWGARHEVQSQIGKGTQFHIYFKPKQKEKP